MRYSWRQTCEHVPMSAPDEIGTAETYRAGPRDHRLDTRVASLVIGTVAIAVSALVGMYLTAALNHWSDAVSLIVPASLAAAAIVSAPAGSAGRRLGWVAIAVLAAGVAAGLIHQGTVGSTYSD
jgi:hypothetical protein